MNGYYRGISFSHPLSLSPSALLSSACGKCQRASRGLSASNPNPSLCLRNGWLSLPHETGLPRASIGLLIKYKISRFLPFFFSPSLSLSIFLSIPQYLLRLRGCTRAPQEFRPSVCLKSSREKRHSGSFTARGGRWKLVAQAGWMFCQLASVMCRPIWKALMGR